MTDITITPEEQASLDSLTQWIYSHTGLHYPQQKQTLLYQRLQSLCWKLQISGLAELHQHLIQKTMPGLVVELANAVSTNHSYFCREEQVMNFFAEQIVNTLPSYQPWRIWSAAAATGEEAYTIAILLAERFGLSQIRQKAAILGTDISQASLDQAERGIYADSKLKNIPQPVVVRYFKPLGLGQWQIDPAIRQAGSFRRLNLMSTPWPFRNQFHVIFCRNVLYYFDTDHQRQLVERLYEICLPDGWLLTSVTESLSGLNTRWRQVSPGIYRKENLAE